MTEPVFEAEATGIVFVCAEGQFLRTVSGKAANFVLFHANLPSVWFGGAIASVPTLFPEKTGRWDEEGEKLDGRAVLHRKLWLRFLQKVYRLYILYCFK